MQNIIIATIKEWNISNYFSLTQNYEGHYQFHLITNEEELNETYLTQLNPAYIFFPHWSWIIPKNIYINFKCIVFHMTDLPYGRGGSPLQNLIIRGIYETKISALRVTDGLDTGDIYLKEDFNISQGSAEEIFIQLSEIVFHKMIPMFLTQSLTAKKQNGTEVYFKRRVPNESDISKLKNKSLQQLYDFIRMLDAEGYPKAYNKIDNFKIEYSNVKKEYNQLTGNFKLTKLIEDN